MIEYECKKNKFWFFHNGHNILIIFEAQFEHNIKNIQKCWNPKILRTFEAEPNFTGSYKKTDLSQFFLTITGICYKGNDTL